MSFLPTCNASCFWTIVQQPFLISPPNFTFRNSTSGATALTPAANVCSSSTPQSASRDVPPHPLLISYRAVANVHRPCLQPFPISRSRKTQCVWPPTQPSRSVHHGAGVRPVLQSLFTFRQSIHLHGCRCDAPYSVRAAPLRCPAIKKCRRRL